MAPTRTAVPTPSATPATAWQLPPASLVHMDAPGADDGDADEPAAGDRVDVGDRVWCGDGLTLAAGCATERSRLKASIK